MGSYLTFAWLFSGAVFSFLWALNIRFANHLDEPRKLWSWILVFSGLWLISGTIYFSGLHRSYPLLSQIHLPFVFLIGPFTYRYLQNFLPECGNKISLKFHSIPFAVVCILYLLALLNSGLEKYIKPEISEKNYLFSVLIALNIFIKIHILVYLTAFIIKNIFPYGMNSFFLKQENLYLFLFFIFIYIALFVGLLGYFWNPFFRELSALLLPMNLYFYFILSGRFPGVISRFQKEFQKKKYEKSRIKTLDIEGIIAEADRIMKEEKAFADEDLTLQSFAEELKINSHQLSQILNERLNRNFFQYVNEYRIAEAKKLIREEKNRNILSIAHAVGFNSKSSFNKAFLQFVGQAPMKYKRSISDS